MSCDFIKIRTIYDSDITISKNEIRFVAPYNDIFKSFYFTLFSDNYFNNNFSNYNEKSTSPIQTINVQNFSGQNNKVKTYLKLKNGIILESIEDYNEINKKLGIL